MGMEKYEHETHINDVIEIKPEVEALSRLANEKPWVAEALKGVTPEQLAESEDVLERIDELARVAAPSVEPESPGLVRYLGKRRGLLRLAFAASVLLSPACKQPTAEELARTQQKHEEVRKIGREEGIYFNNPDSYDDIKYLDAIQAFKSEHPEIQSISINGFEEKNEEGGVEWLVSILVKYDGSLYPSRAFVRTNAQQETDALKVLDKALNQAFLVAERMRAESK